MQEKQRAFLVRTAYWAVWTALLWLGVRYLLRWLLPFILALGLAALVAVNLAVMNLLPLPALDGGKIFFLVVNALSLRIIRKQIPARFENYVHLAGFVLLMGLMLVITFHDVIKLFQ